MSVNYHPAFTSTAFRSVGTRTGHGLAIRLSTLAYIHPPLYLVRGSISLESWLVPALSLVGIQESLPSSPSALATLLLRSL